jgi:hypothetical protein
VGYMHVPCEEGTAGGPIPQVAPPQKHTLSETEAEAVVFVVSTAIGLEPGNASRDYIHLHQGDIGTLTESLAAIQTTARRIIEALMAGDWCIRESSVRFWTHESAKFGFLPRPVGHRIPPIHP